MTAQYKNEEKVIAFARYGCKILFIYAMNGVFQEKFPAIFPIDIAKIAFST